MKYIKRIASLLLVLAMVLTLNISVFAANGINDNTGKITIDNAVNGKDYTIYQIFKLESYDTDKNAYSYKVTDDWNNFINGADIKDVYVTVNADGYVTWKGGTAAAEFAEKAKAYAETLESNQGSQEAAGGKVEFTGLNLGYYLIVSEMGALCSLDTTNPTVTIKEKNGEPTLEKQVQENSKVGQTDEWGETNDASIGDTVNYKVTINVIDGNPRDYVMHDTMSAGLTFQSSSVAVTVNGSTIESGYTVVTEGLSDGCTFEVRFTNGTLKPNDVVVITYSAILNENAVISTDANTNQSHLSYTDHSEASKTTEPDETRTYTYKFDLVKTNAENKLLEGAEFKLYTAKTEGTEIALVKESEGVYRVATAAEKDAENFTAATIEAGKVTIKGLDSGTYWLDETKAPAGYNILPERVEVKIENANLDATMEENTWTAGGVHVVNNTGAELPETGGIGTTIFYVLGGLLVVGAAVLLITKKRMGANH